MKIKPAVSTAILVVTLLTSSVVVSSGEFRTGIGTGLLYGTVDFTITYRPENSHWAFGFAHLYNESGDDNIWDSTDEERYSGPLVKYLIEPEEKGSFYASAGYFKFELEHHVSETGETDSASTSSLFLGAGYTSRFGNKQNYFYDIGFMFNTGDELFVETSVTSVETTGMAGGIVIGVSSF